MALSDEVAKAQAALATVESTVSSGAAKIRNDFLKTGKAWIPLLGLVAIFLLHHYGIDTKIIDLTYNVVVLLLILHYVGHYIIDICNTFVEIAQIKQGQGDGVPFMNEDGSPVVKPAVPPAAPAPPQV